MPFAFLFADFNYAAGKKLLCFSTGVAAFQGRFTSLLPAEVDSKGCIVSGILNLKTEKGIS